MFTVYKREDCMGDNPIEVYDVRTDAKTGYPQFLVYIEREWKYISAKNFMPY